MKSISGTIARALWNNGIIQEEDIDTCRYGLDIFISSAIEIVSILFIAFFVGNFYETFLFFLAFTPLRIYAGGYHANTKMRCYLISLGVYCLFTIITSMLSQETYWMINLISTLFSMSIVLILAPVIHKNKYINQIELKFYRKISILICLMETLIILLLTVIFPKSPYIVSLAIGQTSVTFSMTSERVKGKLTDNKISKLKKTEGGV